MVSIDHLTAQASHFFTQVEFFIKRSSIFLTIAHLFLAIRYNHIIYFPPSVFVNSFLLHTKQGSTYRYQRSEIAFAPMEKICQFTITTTSPSSTSTSTLSLSPQNSNTMSATHMRPWRRLSHPNTLYVSPLETALVQNHGKYPKSTYMTSHVIFLSPSPAVP
mmetsp:Transcript_14090/g.25490  ORF Transcript_14090/g.25490 Transcript_14090/m.25490 type:complete len:162 (-) Transcript_14090:654-1139(-)